MTYRNARVLQVVERFDILSRQVAETLLLPSIRMHVGGTLDDPAFLLGSSRIGGVPDLPPGVDWPRVQVPEAIRDKPAMLRHYALDAPITSLGEERALPFLCQISLAEVASLDLQRVLPQRGLLLFFFDANLEMGIEVFGDASPEKRDTRAWRVVYVEDPGHLQRAAFPHDLAQEQRFAPCPVSFHLEWMLPSVESPLLESVSPKKGRYLALLQAIAG
jgi:uncharacterized protein YwqG